MERVAAITTIERSISLESTTSSTKYGGQNRNRHKQNGRQTDSREPLPKNYPSMVQKWTSYRYRLCYMMVLAIALIQSQQSNMAFALVCMTGGDRATNDSQMNISNTHNITLNDITKQPEFDWDSTTQGLVLSSTFYAALVSPFVGSWMSSKLGPRLVIFLSMTVSSLASLLTPVSARVSVYLAIVCRIALGACLNTILPVSQDLWIHWAPIQDKSQLMALCFTGNNIANMVTFSVSGYLCTLSFDNGWPLIFYVFGGVSLVWSVWWLMSVHDTPENHPSITAVEKQYIILNRTGAKQKAQIPWTSLMSSLPVWAIIITYFSHIYTSGLLFNYLPTYMNTVLEFPITQNGLLSSVPYVTRLIGMISWTVFSNAMVRRIGVTATRKTIQTISAVGSAVTTLGIVFVPVRMKVIAVVLFACLTPLQAGTVSGAMVTVMDIAPQFASLITAFATTAAVCAQLISPIVTSYLIPERSKEQWNVAFYLNAGLFIFALAVFLIFGSGKLQSWACKPEDIPRPTHHNNEFVEDVPQCSQCNMSSTDDAENVRDIPTTYDNMAFSIDTDEEKNRHFSIRL